MAMVKNAAAGRGMGTVSVAVHDETAVFSGRDFNHPARYSSVRREKALAQDMESLRAWCTELGVDADVAEGIYREAVSAGFLEGRHVKGLLAASIYVAGRRSGTPVTLLQIAAVTGEQQRTIRRTVLLVAEGGMPPQDVRTYIKAGSQRLNLPDGVWSLVDLDCIREDLGAPLRAGIALLVASHRFGSPRSIEQVAAASGINPKTFRHYVRKDGTMKPKAVAG